MRPCQRAAQRRGAVSIAFLWLSLPLTADTGYTQTADHWKETWVTDAETDWNKPEALQDWLKENTGKGWLTVNHRKVFD